MIRPALTLLCLAAPAHADGIATMLMPDVAPCDIAVQTQEQFERTVIGDPAGLYTIYLGLHVLNCGPIANPYDVANYVPGDKLYYWDQPPLLPHVPAPVPLPASAILLLTAILALALKRIVR